MDIIPHTPFIKFKLLEDCALDVSDLIQLPFRHTQDGKPKSPKFMILYLAHPHNKQTNKKSVAYILVTKKTSDLRLN